MTNRTVRLLAAACVLVLLLAALAGGVPAPAVAAAVFVLPAPVPAARLVGAEHVVPLSSARSALPARAPPLA